MTTGSDKKTGLVLQGGGARGAYQVGALKAIAEIYGKTQNPFPIISGTSVGAINASSLASHSANFEQAALHLEALWRGLRTGSIFDPSARSVAATVWRVVRTFLLGGKTNRYGWLDNRPLRRLLEQEFDRQAIDRAYSVGDLDGFCITTACYASGMAVTHYESQTRTSPWKKARREGRPDRLSVDHLMASSALPLIFPAIRIDHSFHGDGALRLTTPLSPVIRMGADKIVIIGVRDAEIISDDKTHFQDYPSVGEMSGHALDILFNDSLDSDVERVKRINRLIAQVPDGRPERLRPIDLLMLQPTQDLREIAKQFEREMPRMIRLILKSIGASGSDGRLPSYLLFEPGYINALIELGYKDTINRADEIVAFLFSDDAQ